MADESELVRGKNVVAVIAFRESSIYPTDASPVFRPTAAVGNSQQSPQCPSGHGPSTGRALRSATALRERWPSIDYIYPTPVPQARTRLWPWHAADLASVDQPAGPSK